jgi:osmotically-inducible protein OsmY
MRSWIFVALLAAAAAGCTTSKNVAQGTGDLAKAAEKKIDQAGTDPSITYAVKAKLVNDPDVEADKLRVRTKDGIVTLTGTQPSENARHRAEELARTARGVNGVVNRIEVKQP